LRWLAGVLLRGWLWRPLRASRAQESELKDDTGKTSSSTSSKFSGIAQGTASNAVLDPAKQVGLNLCSQEHDTPTGNDLFRAPVSAAAGAA